jgi:hypothetical protein
MRGRLPEVTLTWCKIETRERINSVKSAKRHAESGQGLVMALAMILSLLLFFQFVINTGVLVTAKISLQNAADAAAYAGASVQGRQMNAVSFLNYEMLRQYKKFLARYVVVGNLGKSDFPNLPNANPTYALKLINNAGQPSSLLNTGVPSVCIPINIGTASGGGPPSKDVSCGIAGSPSTSNIIAEVYRNSASGQSISALGEAMITNASTLDGFVRKKCLFNGQLNEFILLNWLFNTDGPNTNGGTFSINAMVEQFLGTLTSSTGITVTNQEKQTLTDSVRFLTQGLGLFPRNMLHLLRIRTLTDAYLNRPPRLDVTSADAEALAKSNMADVHERTLQAYYSALYNLNETVFDRSTFRMSEIMAPPAIRIEEQLVDFVVYVQRILPTQGDLATVQSACVSSIDAREVKGAPIGIKRADTSQLAYAVHLKSEAKLLFLPGTIELEATAAAKPFGSRMSPTTLNAQAEYTKQITPGSTLIPDSPTNSPVQILCTARTPLTGTNTPPEACTLPNLKVGRDGSDFQSTPFLIGLLGGPSPLGQGYLFNPSLVNQVMNRSMLPYRSEVGRYNILPKASHGVRACEHINYASTATAGIYQFYAPLTPPDSAAKVSDEINKLASSVFSDSLEASASPGNAGFLIQDLKSRLVTGLQNYVQTMKTGAPQDAEDGESETSAAVQIPTMMRSFPANSSTYFVPAGQNPDWNNPKYVAVATDEVLTSWGPSNERLDPNPYSCSTGLRGLRARFGYSVKMVGFDTLRSGSSAISGGDPNYERIQH